MSLYDVMQGLATALKEVAGLRVYDFPSDRVETPAAVLSLPETPYDVTLGGRSDEWTFPLWVLVAKADDKAAYGEMVSYLDAEGDHSIRAMIEADPTLGGACDTAQVIRARPLFATVAGTEFLAVEFTVEVYGAGTGIPSPTPPSGDRVITVNGVEKVRISIDHVLILGETNDDYLSNTALDFQSSVNSFDYGYSEFGFVLANPDNPDQTVRSFGFGSDGVFPNAGPPNARTFYVYDYVLNRVVFTVTENRILTGLVGIQVGTQPLGAIGPDGLIEFDGTHFYGTVGGVRKQLDN